VRKWYGLCVAGYVVMPEHVHLLLSEPERTKLPTAIQMLKQNVARKLGPGQFWQVRYYDFLVWSRKKRIEKLKYMHRNPVQRGLVEHPEDWRWSSFQHYSTGCEGRVEIESEWTARRRERMGITLRVAEPKEPSHPVAPKAGATRVGQPRKQS
jgi:putative transposase